MLLSVPEPVIDLYNSGFNGVCNLGRATDGKKLSELVEKVSEPLVIAVDAPWGAGKSVFLKCWVGAHKNENNGSATTVYFDAFRHDFMDDPLIGLTSIIAERLKTGNVENSIWRKAKEAASKLVRPTLRTGLAVATAGVTELTGPIVDAALEAGSKELSKASEQFWKKEDGKRAAMSGFREALTELSSKQKLVIVVDELDRCRPDYALSLLEVMKHFFDVKNVHFVLGVNLKELRNSVKSRYGTNANADKYLQKFISVRMPLIPRPSAISGGLMQVKHFNNVVRKIGISDTWKYRYLELYLNLIDYHIGLTLRDVEKIVTLAMVTPEPASNPEASAFLYTGLIILEVIEPNLVMRARSGTLKKDEIFQVFYLDKFDENSSFKTDATYVWRLATWDPLIQKPNDDSEAQKKLFGGWDPKETLRKTISDTLDVFKIMQ